MTFEEWWGGWGHSFEASDKYDGKKLAKAAWEAAQPKWCPIETAPMGKAVLVFYKNSLGKDRVIKAQYIKKHTEEACEECVAIGFSDYCEEKDEYFTPEGWYEIIDNGHEYSSYFLEASNKPTHWMPLPPSPEEQ